MQDLPSVSRTLEQSFQISYSHLHSVWWCPREYVVLKIKDFFANLHDIMHTINVYLAHHFLKGCGKLLNISSGCQALELSPTSFTLTSSVIHFGSTATARSARFVIRMSNLGHS